MDVNRNQSFSNQIIRSILPFTLSLAKIHLTSEENIWSPLVFWNGTPIDVPKTRISTCSLENEML